MTVTLAAKLSGAAANNLRFDLGNAASVIVLTNTANSWEGATTLAGSGILRIGAAGVIPDGGGTIEAASGTRLDLNGFSETIGGLSGAGTVDNMLASSTSIISVGGNNASTTFSGILQNSGASSSLALTKVGTGTLTLSNAANTFGGGTTVSAGILQVNNAGALGSGNVTLNASNSASPSGNRAQLWLNGVTVTGKTLTLNPTTNRAQLIATGVTGANMEWHGHPDRDRRGERQPGVHEQYRKRPLDCGWNRQWQPCKRSSRSPGHKRFKSAFRGGEYRLNTH
jgi:fibronectin-binding autotransporter adhesin